MEPVLALARRLAEEFDTVPLPMVSRAVKSAAQAVNLFGDSTEESLATVERIAREDLIALRQTAVEQSAAEQASAVEQSAAEQAYATSTGSAS